MPASDIKEMASGGGGGGTKSKVCKGSKCTSIQCEVCDDWFHCGCVNLSESAYNTLEHDKSVHSYCLGYTKGVVNVSKDMIYAG